jgi:DNA ligase-1
LRGDAAEEARLGGALTAPVQVKKGTGGVAGAPVMLAEVWDGVRDIGGWWMSEKLDGVRAYWDGKQLLSRLGNVYHAPEWFLAGLPGHALDGELFLARKSFQKTIAIVRRQDKSEHWKEIKFLVFDVPGHGGTFEERMEAMRGLAAAEFMGVHGHVLARDGGHVREELSRVEALGGEGLMLREPGSAYVAGRSSTLLKVKSFLDEEAVVVGHQAGTGRHKGRMGALLVRMANGTEFAIGTGFSDKERDNPAAVGATVRFKYQELSDGGVPRFPSYAGVVDEL